MTLVSNGQFCSTTKNNNQIEKREKQKKKKKKHKDDLSNLSFQSCKSYLPVKPVCISPNNHFSKTVFPSSSITQ